MADTTAAYIALGSNTDDGDKKLKEARIELSGLLWVDVGAVSSVYYTEPQGTRHQNWFHNQVMRLDCGPEITSEMLLYFMLKVEDRMGRVRDPHDRNGPRVIDLDLLVFGQEIHSAEANPDFILPHPRMTERAFVLVPLREIAPDLVIPGTGKTVDQHLGLVRYRLEGNKIFQS